MDVKSANNTAQQRGLFLPKSLAYSSPFLMFPCREKPPAKLDPYGTPLDPEMWDLLHGRRQTDNAIGRGFTPLPKPTIPQEFAER